MRHLQAPARARVLGRVGERRLRPGQRRLRALGEEDEVEPQRLDPAPPGRVGAAGDGALDHRQRVVGAAHRPEQQQRAQLGQLEREVRIVELWLEFREQRVGDLGPAPLRLGAREQHHGDRPGAGVAGELRQLRPEIRVAGQHRGARRIHGELRGDRPGGVEQPPGDPHRVGRLARLACADHLGEPHARVAGSQRRQLRAHHLSVERMRHAHGAVAVGGDQPAPLDRGGRVDSHELLELADAQGLAQGEQLERPPLVRAQPRESLTDHPGERRARPGPPDQPPEPLAILERPLGERADQQLAHVQRIAAAALLHPTPRGALDGTAEHGLDEPAGGRRVERGQLHSRQARVLPQRLDRVGPRLGGPHRDDHEGGPSEHEVKHERGGRRVEQLPVVDAEHDRPAGRALLEGGPGAPHQLERAAAVAGAREQRGECAERHRRGALRRLHPRGMAARLAGGGHGVAGDAGLADAGRGGDHDAGRAGRAQPGDALELRVAPDQRPFQRLGRQQQVRRPGHGTTLRAVPAPINGERSGSGRPEGRGVGHQVTRPAPRRRRARWRWSGRARFLDRGVARSI